MQALEVEKLTKVYNKTITAVKNINFQVEEGEIFGLLGPNGAGKTTAIKMITTLANPTSGAVRVFGLDALTRPQEVRQCLSYVPQAVSVDGDLTAYENILIFAKLSYVSKKERKERITSSLDYMGLGDRKNDLVKHFSGGMMRRLEIAQALVNRPRILILDEPSIGLDPSSKRQMWDYLKQLNSEFHVTVLITTHDMMEADELCDRIAIMNSGNISVIGNPKDLKLSVGSEILTIVFPSDLGKSIIEQMKLAPGLGSVDSLSGRTLKILTQDGERTIPRVLDFFEVQGIEVESVSLNKPSLDDVFSKYSKSTFEDEGIMSQVRTVRRTFARRSA